MENEVPGSLGTSSSLGLRLGQAIFSMASLMLLCLDIEFYNYTSFSYLVVVMGLLIPWSTTLAVVDAWCVFVKCFPRHHSIMFAIVIGDWVLSYLLLGATSSAASVTDLMFNSTESCPTSLCNRYLLSVVMSFLSWTLLLASSLFNLWLLSSL